MASMDAGKLEYNILLVGETGVGKSTFINAFANYLNFSNFEEARRAEKTHMLIPASFVITDENFQEHHIKEGNDSNECHKDGESATQNCRTYTFETDLNMAIRIIDTPGIGDTRGIEQDEKNLAHMVDFLGKFSYINAIVFMFLPTNTRLTPSFKYCIQQLLASLEKSAVNNIAFLFTNCRGKSYGPGDTLVPLRQMLKDIGSKPPHVEVPFDKTNMFCFDNEAFRFLLACRKNCHFDKEVIDSVSNSWNKSVSTAQRLLEFIASRPPHNIKDSTSLVKARRAIETLRTPLVDISQFMQRSINNIEQCEQELKNNTSDNEKLKKLLIVKRTGLNITSLSSPMNVCTHVFCTERTQVEHNEKIHYKSECHNPCRVRGAVVLVRNDQRMRYCSVMENKGKADATCSRCHHHHLHHMHIDYKTESYEVELENDQVKKDIENNEINEKTIKAALSQYAEHKDKYKQEKEFVLLSIAKFAHYLKNCAIVSYNDAFEDYVKYLIEREKQNDDGTENKKILNYEKLIDGYHMQKDILDKNLSESTTDEESNITGTDILALVDKLFELELSGKEIQKMYEATMHHTTVEIEETVMSIRGAKKVMGQSINFFKSLFFKYPRHVV